MRLLIPGMWVPLETAEAHYSACDAMELSNDETIEMGRSVLMRTQKTFLGTVGSAAAGAGATP